MNNQEPESIYKRLESIITRAYNVSSPKHYLPIIIGEFGKELYENQTLENIRQDIADQGKEYFIPLRTAKDKVLNNFDQLVQILRSHASKFPRLSPYLLKYDEVIKNNIAGSYTLIDQLEPLLRNAITEMSYNNMYFQASQITVTNSFAIKHAVDEYLDHSDVLPHLIISNNAGRIVFAYSQDLSNWHMEFSIFERNKITTVFYSFHYLTEKYALCYDIRKRPNRIYNLEEEIIAYKKKDAFNFDLAIQTNRTTEALAYEVDIEECKACVDRVWEFIKPRLPKDNEPNVTANSENSLIYGYAYSDKNGLQKGDFYAGENILENLTGISAAVLDFLLKQKTAVRVDEIIDAVIPVNEYDNLPKSKKQNKIHKEYRDTAPKDKIRNAIETIHDKLSKFFPEDLITIPTKGMREINPIYKQKLIRIKKSKKSILQ